MSGMFLEVGSRQSIVLPQAIIAPSSPPYLYASPQDKIAPLSVYLFPACWDLAQESRSGTVRLKTGAPGADSSESTQK